jgi:hypothetical protein
MNRLDAFCTTRWVLLFAAAMCGPAQGQATLEIVPASPRYQEPVYARLALQSSGHCVTDAFVTMSESTIYVHYTYSIVFPVSQDPCLSRVDVQLGRFPQGNYMVLLLNPAAPPILTGFSVSPLWTMGAGVPRVDYSGMWWNPGESGWGLSISHGPTHGFFAAWFAYDASGAPTWYTLESGGWGAYGSQTGYVGRVYRYTGPRLGSTFDPAKVVAKDVGTARLTFDSANSGTLTYAIEGASGSRAITRLPIE